jgi:hypothetical protein
MTLRETERWLRTEPIYRVVYDRRPPGPYPGRVNFIEASSVEDATRMVPAGVRVVECRRAKAADAREVREMERRGW